MMRESRESGSEANPHPDWPNGYWERLDDLRLGLDLGDIPPLGRALLEVEHADER